MDGMFKNRQQNQNEIIVQKDNNYDVWSQKLVQEPTGLLSKKELERKRKNLSKKEIQNENRTLLEEENIHIAGDEVVEENDRRLNLFNLATAMKNAGSAYTLRMNKDLKDHEDHIETLNSHDLFTEMQKDMQDFMNDDFLTHDNLVELGKDENLFSAYTLISTLKGKVEKLKLDIMYLQGSKEAKDGIILQDADMRDAFYAKFKAAQMLIAYQETRIAICSDTYYRDRNLLHMTTTTSTNAKRMQIMMEDSKQKYLRFLECIENLPADDQEQLEVNEELEEMAEDIAVDQEAVRQEIEQFFKDEEAPKDKEALNREIEELERELKEYDEEMQQQEAPAAEQDLEHEQLDEEDEETLDRELEEMIRYVDEHYDELEKEFSEEEAKEQQDENTSEDMLNEEMLKSVVTVIPSNLSIGVDKSFYGSIGKIDRKDTDELSSEIRRMKAKQQLSDDISKENTDNEALRKVFSMLQEYSEINVTAGDAMAAYRVPGGNYKEITKNIAREKKLIYDAVSQLSQLNSLITENKENTLDDGTKKLVKKYYDRLKDQCFGTLSFEEGHKIHIAKLMGESVLDNLDGLTTTKLENELLFSHEPCINDVIQGSLADCMLMGALTAIVKDHPETITGMMRDNGDSVTVRFFQKDSKSGEFEPYYINVPKVRTSANRHAESWVKILETAYATFRLYTLMPERPKEKLDKWIEKSNTFKRLNGQTNIAESPELLSDENMFANVHILYYGDKDYKAAYGALTGTNCIERDRIHEDADYFTKRKTNNMEVYLEQMKKHAKHADPGLDRYETPGASSEESKFKEQITDKIITQLSAVHLFQEMDYAKDEGNPEDTLMLFSKKATIEDVKEFMTSLTKVTDALLDKGGEAPVVTKYLKQYRLDSDLGNRLLKEIREFGPGWTTLVPDLKKMISDRLELFSQQADKLKDLDHRGFGGEYTDSAINTFNEIGMALANGKTVGASTYAFRKRGSESGESGESMVDGITYGHQYTVLEVAEGEFNNAKFIKLRNPWGRYSREYEVVAGEIVPKVKKRESGDPNYGIIYVELNEFMNKFRGYSIG